jgi:hypothetical protein
MRQFLTTSASYFSFIAALALAGACSSSSNTGGDAGTCTPTTCAAQNKNCGAIVDGCGKSLQCGTCSGSDTCGGGNTANVCGTGTCTNLTTCAAEGKNCGLISDGCNAVLECGDCGAGTTCGGGGVANVCGATSSTDAGGSDASTSVCNPTCMQGANAVCCTTCGCTTTDCKPTCADPLKWDCEMGCCFNYTTLKCG